MIGFRVDIFISNSHASGHTTIEERDYDTAEAYAVKVCRSTSVSRVRCEIRPEGSIADHPEPLQIVRNYE